MYVTQVATKFEWSKKLFLHCYVCLFNNYLKYSVIFPYFRASVKLFLFFRGKTGFALK